MVKDGETLNSIAASYDTTPSLLAQLNRLSSSSFLFPGKKLKIPPKEVVKPKADASDESDSKPRLRSVKEEEEYVVPGAYIKVNVKRVTQGHGCIHGCILLTNKSFMFSPNQTDPAVHEFQQEMRDNFFEVYAPSELVVNLAVFKDLRFERNFGRIKDRDNTTDYSEFLYVPSPTAAKGEKEEAVDGEKASGDNNQSADNEESKKKVSDDDLAEPGLPDPLYLRVTMGKPVGKKLDRDAAILSDGEQDLKPFYWFMIRPARARRFHDFVVETFPDGKYGLLDHMSVERGGHEVIREGAAILESDGGANRQSIARLARHMHETFTSVDFDNCSRQIGESNIMRDGDRLRIAARLPPAAVVGLDWELSFSTTSDGFSLSSVYRKLNDHDGPVVMLVESAGGHAFGAFLTSAPRLTEKFMGGCH